MSRGACPQGIISRWKDEEYEQRLAAGIPDAALAPAPTTADASSSSSHDVEEEDEDSLHDTRQAHHVAKGGHHEHELPTDTVDKALAKSLKRLAVDAAQQDTAEDQQDQLQDSSDVV